MPSCSPSSPGLPPIQRPLPAPAPPPQVFSKVGDIKRIVMGLDKHKLTPCGFCFVVYYTREDTEDCVKASGAGGEWYCPGGEGRGGKGRWGYCSLGHGGWVFCSAPAPLCLSAASPTHALIGPCPAPACPQYVNGTMLDDRPIRVDFDWGFVEGRQFGRGRSGGQVRRAGWALVG